MADKIKMNKGLTFSAILHFAVFMVVMFGLPSFSSKNIKDEQVITVELLSVSEISNVAPRKVKPKFRPKPPKKEILSAAKPKKSLPDPAKKPEVVEKNLEPLVSPKLKEKPKKEVVKEVKKPAPKPQVKKVEEKVEKKIEEPKEPEIDFGAVLKSIEEISLEDEKNEEESAENFDSVEDFLSNVKDETKYKPGHPLSISEKDEIKRQITENWTVPAGAKDAQEMAVSLRVFLARDGMVQKVIKHDKLRYASDSYFRTMVDSAVRAVYKTAKLKNLPADKYDVRDGWRELDLNFNPSEMLY